MGDPCPYCLAHKLAGTKQRKGKYWLGARIGTAIHNALEEQERKHLVKAESYHFKPLEGALVEYGVTLGTIPGYGTITSTLDLYLSSEQHLIDHKTSKRTRSREYLLNGAVPEKYVYQGMLYARALEDEGKPVKKVSFVFINRDGTGDTDVQVISYDYDRSMADAAWDRTEAAWQWLQAGGDPETLPSDPDCFNCSVNLGRI